MCQKERFVIEKTDQGSGSVLGLMIILASLGIIGTIFQITNGSVELARLQAQSDSAAVAAVDVLRGLSSGYPCETAEEIVKGFGAKLARCHIVSFDIYIVVYRETMGIVHRVQSHAGVGMDDFR
ncbi:MAG: hypothetical protein EBR26_03070 [Microbacteriaceae bacterium]|nr:hypothetical protein [Microbacteriaceae bacterium]